MQITIVILLCLSLFAWLYLIFFWGRSFFSNQPFFWTNKVFFQSSSEQMFNKKPKPVTVIIPARNEETNITKTLSKLIKQDDVKLKIIIVDDNSTDETFKIARNFLITNSFKKFKIIHGKKLPPDWSGKVWALKQGVELALKDKLEFYLLLLDADISLNKDVLKSLIKKIDKEDLQMISLMAKLKCESFWEKLLIPSFIFFFQKLYPFNIVNQANSSLSAAAGGCIMSHSKIFRKNPLFDLIKNKIIDDCNLAKLIKKEGKIWLGLTNSVKSERKYLKLNEIWKMISRTAFEQLNHSFSILILSSLGMILLYLLFPFMIFLSIFDSNFSIFILGISGYILTSIVYFPTIKFYNLPKIYIFSLPVSGLIYLIITLHSAINHYRDFGNTWKERNY